MHIATDDQLGSLQVAQIEGCYAVHPDSDGHVSCIMWRLSRERIDHYSQLPTGELLRQWHSFTKLSPHHFEVLRSNRNRVLQWMDLKQTRRQWIDVHADIFARRAIQKNQYFSRADIRQKTAVRIYEPFLAELLEALAAIRTDGDLYSKLRVALETHHDRLIGHIGDLYVEGFGAEVDTPVCAEYSPQLQLSILGLDVRSLHQPVLDLGCGREAHLVRFLRERSVDAWGVDHAFDNDQDYLSAGDWLTCPLSERSWGTIISHMAFSNHFVHHHLNRNGVPALYAQRYMEILRALRPGGIFAYAPSIPFIEHLLPSRLYRVQAVESVGGSSATSVCRLT